MIRRFNYTRRQRIPRDQVSIQLRSSERTDGPLGFDAELDLNGLDLPGHADVYLEAHFKSSYQRFGWGTVAKLVPSADRRLTEIDRGTVVFFRVKVVDCTTEIGCLLAEADGITVEEGGEASTSRKSILPVNYCDLGDQIWRVDFSGMCPVLEVNKHIDSIPEIVSRDSFFMSLVFPAVLRQVLQHMLLVGVEEEWQDEESDDWPSLWRRFVKQFFSEDAPTIEDGPEDQLRWIDAVVAEFCSNQKVREQFVIAVRERER